MKRCFIFAAGTFYGLREAPRADDVTIAADAGLHNCRSAGIEPELVIGDFDSMAQPPRGDCVVAPVEKDDTDTMLAVREGLARGCGEFYIYGGTGGVRLDHTLANLQTLAFLRRHGARGYLYDCDFVYTVLENETLTLRRQVEWGLVSLFAMSGTQQDVTLEGLQYPLTHGTLTGDLPIGVSNHFIADTARITCGSGLLLVGWQLPPLTETPADRSQAVPPAR